MDRRQRSGRAGDSAYHGLRSALAVMVGDEAGDVQPRIGFEPVD